MDIRRHKPLLGFGPTGWIALAILTAFIVALSRGWDPVYAFARVIWHFSDDKIGNWARIWVVVWLYPSQQMLGVTFGFWGLLYSSVAFFIFPRKLPAIPIALLFITVAAEAFAYGFATPAFLSNFPFHLMPALTVSAALVEFGLILWITRRWWCAAPFLIPLFWNVATFDVMSAKWSWPYFPYIRVATHLAIAIPLLSWAITARLKPAPPGKPCPSCDYDLTGLADSTPCPECGRVSTPPAPATA